MEELINEIEEVDVNMVLPEKGYNEVLEENIDYDITDSEYDPSIMEGYVPYTGMEENVQGPAVPIALYVTIGIALILGIVLGIIMGKRAANK